MKRVIITNHDKWHAEIYHFVQRANQAQKCLKFQRLRLEKADQDLFVADGDALNADKALGDAQSLKDRHRLDPNDTLIAFVDVNLADSEDDEYFLITDRIDSPGVVVISLYYMTSSSTFMNGCGRWWTRLRQSERRRILSDSVLLLLLNATVSGVIDLDCHDDSRGCVMDYCQNPTDLLAALKGGFEFCGETCRPLLEANPQGSAVLETASYLTRNPFRYHELTGGDFDVFLCHNSLDKPAVRDIHERLKARGVQGWLDEEQLPPGASLMTALGEQIDKTRIAAIFMGPNGLGRWQGLEVEGLIEQLVNRQCPLIPVILPGVTGTPKLPTFVSGKVWVDFRKDHPDPLERLIWGITGELPRPSSPAP